MIRIMDRQLPIAIPAGARTKSASVRRLSMLRCNIALAAKGANSQLSAAGHGGFCEPASWHFF
jgi:hypothetical protein